jgi:hypothetical protein
MKTEDRKVGEAGCAPVYGEVPATHKMGDAMGRPRGRSSFLEGPGAKFFCGKRGNGPNPEERGQEEGSDPSASGRPLGAQIQSLQEEESSVRSLIFCFSSLAEPVAVARSGQGRAVFWRGEAHP